MSLALGLAALYSPGHQLGRLPLIAGIAGAIGVVLGAAVAGLLGLYLAVAAIIAVALARRAATRRAVGLTLAVTAAITIGVLGLRSGDLGAFLRSVGIGEQRNDPFGNAASWNERLIDAYIGGRIFLDNPIVGTGWHGELPPDEYTRYIDDAHARFPDQPDDLLPVGRRLHPAADLRPGALRAGDRRRDPLPRPGLRGRADRRARGAGLAARRSGRAIAYLPAAWLARARRRPRRRGALRRDPARGDLLDHDRRHRARALPRTALARPGPAMSRSIVHVIARLNVGGAALPVLELAARAARRGHDVLVVAGTIPPGEESMEYVADELGVPYLHLPALQRELSPRGRRAQRS